MFPILKNMFAYSKSVCKIQNKCLGNQKMSMIFLKVCVLKSIDKIEQNFANSKMFMNWKIS